MRDQSYTDRTTALKVFVALAAIAFLLRIFYAAHLYQDDGLWFTAAEEILRGKALYGEIYFDKPPVLPLVYAALFKIFGAHILTIRLFTIFYSLAVSFVLYRFGSLLYDRRTGLAAATMFAVFSTTYQEGHFQGLNTDFLMTLPYAAAAYLMVRSRFELSQGRWLVFAGGAAAGLAFQINPKAIFNLIFFAAFLFISHRLRRRDTMIKASTGNDSPLRLFTSSPAQLFALSLAGFVAGALPFWIYIAATGSLDNYRLYVWDWGSRYAGYYPAFKVVASALRQSIDYFALNNTLLVALIFVIASVIRRRRRGEAKTAPGAAFKTGAGFRADATLLIWLAVSYAGLAVGGRFFGHYFFQILPALCLIGARGLIGILGWRPNRPSLRVVAVALLALGFFVTLARYHARTVALASDWARGAKSDSTRQWFHEKLNSEERAVAAIIREWPGGPDSVDDIGTEAMRIDGDGSADEAADSTDHLFVWGYRPEIYFWTGLRPASRFLSTQPLTGVPADVHYFGDDFRPLLDEEATARARAKLVGDLEQTRPEFIVDELALFNAHLSIMSFPELEAFMGNYKMLGVIERFVIYRNKQFMKKRRQRIEAPQQ
jgi:Dolichyl-phosphate-mannose-protein mannosyltransferase